MTDQQDSGPGLLNELVHATYWLDDSLQAYMRHHAGMSLPRAQSMMMVYIAEGVDRPADLAVRLRISKQAVQQGLKALAEKDIVAIDPHPTNRRQKIIHFTEHGRQLRNIAQQGLRCLEDTLCQRIGHQRYQALRSALGTQWGPTPLEDSQLETAL